jgi:hypothetical protein
MKRKERDNLYYVLADSTSVSRYNEVKYEGGGQGGGKAK